MTPGDIIDVSRVPGIGTQVIVQLSKEFPKHTFLPESYSWEWWVRVAKKLDQSENLTSVDVVGRQAQFSFEEASA